MTDTWPPSAETLETWAFIVDAVNEPEYTTPELAAFLRDPRLREALELMAAVARSLNGGFLAVCALRAKIEKEGA